MVGCRAVVGNQAEIHSANADLARFKGFKWVNPLGPNLRPEPGARRSTVTKLATVATNTAGKQNDR